MFNQNSKNRETSVYSPAKSRGFKNYQQSTAYLQISKGKSIQFKNQRRRYPLRCSHQQHLNQNLTFKPLINQLPFQIYSGTKKEKLNISREQIRQRLIEDATKAIRDRLSTKIQLQDQEQKKHSFHPKISAFAKQLSRFQKYESVYQRLFNNAEQIRQEKVQMEKMKDEQQKKQIKRLLNYKLSFSNKKLLNQQKHNLQPIQNRIQQIVENKIKLRKSLQKQIQQQKSINFHPKISQKSQKMAERRIQRQKLKMDVVERLMEEYQRMKKDRQRSLETLKMKQYQQCTFNPQINQNYTFSRYSNKDKSMYYEKLQSSHWQCSEDQQRKYSFVPKINHMSDLIVLHKRANQEMGSKLYRLSKQPIQDKKQAIERIRSQIQSNFTFRPKLNDITYMMQPQPKSHRCQLPPPEIFTFQPTINERSKLIRPQSAERAKIKTKKKILQYKLQSEYQELKQCSFHPKINNKRHQEQRRLNSVEGIQKFMSLKQKAKQKVVQQRQREKNLFHLEIKYDERRNHKFQN